MQRIVTYLFWKQQQYKKYKKIEPNWELSRSKTRPSSTQLLTPQTMLSPSIIKPMPFISNPPHYNYTTACNSTIKFNTWFININIVCDSDKEWLNLRSAWLINLACIAMWASPISPSSSPLGTRAATWH